MKKETYSLKKERYHTKGERKGRDECIWILKRMKCNIDTDKH